MPIQVKCYISENMLNKYLKTLALILISLNINTFANEESEGYMDNGLPIHFKYMNGKTPIYIEFTDVIQDRYLVDVEWFPNWGLAPLLTGPANINFRVKDTNFKFTIKSQLFHIAQRIFSFPNYRMNAETITKKEVLKMKYWHLANPPFAFGDMNFDDIKELVISEKRGGQRGHDAYKVYLLQEIEDTEYFNVVNLSNVKPYSDIDQTTQFDWDNKTIRVISSAGACGSMEELYERVYSDFPMQDYKFKLTEKIQYLSWDKDGNDIPCTMNAYDIVDGIEVLNEAKSGPIN